VAGISQTDVRPPLSAVGRFVDAVSSDDVTPQARFAGTDIKNIGIGRIDRDRADREDALLI